jgi:hypothetical protein
MEAYHNALKLERFITSQIPLTSKSEYTVKTKCNHIFNYEDGNLSRGHAKHSDYIKALEFIRKNLLKAVQLLQTKSKNKDNVYWSKIIERIETAENGNDFLGIIDILI